ncbi:PREDICTED: protein BEAN1-like [Chlamydotis macqueenii]|uniref:protein BEAN1-like n=1 Tax=Chlamydotis macqueenii TaxID=187382 RepID=UPI0005299944|nr:PREDICTED: protein BEAN1-like [Chlamydotis macqueenii]
MNEPPLCCTYSDWSSMHSFVRVLCLLLLRNWLYDECVGPGATQIYIPTDDPPPYSLTDPCQRNEISINISLEEEAASVTTGQAANYAVRLQDLQQPISSISLSSLTLEAAPLYETVVCEQNIPIPLVPMEVLKNSSTDYQTFLNQIM